MLETTFHRAIKIKQRVCTVLHGKIASPTPDAEFFKSVFKRLEATANNGVFYLILNEAVNGAGHINVLPVAKEGR